MPSAWHLLGNTTIHYIRDGTSFTVCLHMQEMGSRCQEATVLEENLRVARPWGFELDDIRVPVGIWQGEQDIGCTPVRWMGRGRGGQAPVHVNR